MKILSNLFLCALILCALSSCQKVETELPITVEGKWEISAVSCQDGIQTVFENGSTSGGAFIFEGRSFSSELDFKSDATFTGSGKFTKVFSTLVDGSMQTDSYQATDFAYEGLWEKSDINLEVTHNDIETFEIVELTSNKMQLKFNLDEKIEKDERTTHQMGTVFYTLRR